MLGLETRGQQTLGKELKRWQSLLQQAWLAKGKNRIPVWVLLTCRTSEPPVQAPAVEHYARWLPGSNREAMDVLPGPDMELATERSMARHSKRPTGPH